jgi:putative transposase
MLKVIKSNKTQIALKLGISRSSLYYQPVKDQYDLLDKQIILQVMKNNQSYGHKRIALHLGWGKNKVKRLMKKFNLKPYRRRIQQPPTKNSDINSKNNNCINIYTQCPVLNQIDQLNILWRGDFTYIKIHNKFFYQATVIEAATREVIGMAISDKHDSDLVIKALIDALSKHSPPLFFHSDQGSEYSSQAFKDLLNQNNIIQSMSDKSSPWQNGQQESFFSHFKLEFGDFNRFNSVGETIAYIYDRIDYYNNVRIHTALKMPPSVYRRQLLTNLRKY